MRFLALFFASLPIILFTEAWGNDWQDRWDAIGYAYDCSFGQNGILIQNCQSAALVSVESFPITQSIAFHGSLYSDIGTNSSTPSNMAHHTLFGADDGDNGQYCGLYLSYNPSNESDEFYAISYPTLEWLAQYPHSTHEVSVTWNYAYTENNRHYGQCVYAIEGRVLSTIEYIFTVDSLRLWVGANSVSPNMPNDGSTSYAEHGVLYVEIPD